MAVLTLSARGMGAELVDGIPQYIELNTNVPSTIFYTLDGSEPTIVSRVYLNPIELPFNNSVNLRALAVSGADIAILDLTFKPDLKELDLPWRTEDTGLGVVFDAYNVANQALDGYISDESNNIDVPARFSDLPINQLDLSPKSLFEHQRLISIGFTGDPRPIEFKQDSPNNNNVFFNPRALCIVVDGRDGYDDQVYDGYRMINRPYGSTTDTLRYSNGKMLYNKNPYITGGFVRTFYSKENRLSVSYYFDHNETRWIKSIQRFDPDQIPSESNLQRVYGRPFVYKWITNKQNRM